MVTTGNCYELRSNSSGWAAASTILAGIILRRRNRSVTAAASRIGPCQPPANAGHRVGN
jgi:hypothetical protein